MRSADVDRSWRAPGQATDRSEPREIPEIPVPPAIGAAPVLQDGGGGQEPVQVGGTHRTTLDLDLQGAFSQRLTSVAAQPFSWKAGFLFILTGAGLVWYFEDEKKRMHTKRIAEANKGVGRPKVGGSFDLIDQNGNKVTDQDLKGRYSLVSVDQVTWKSREAACPCCADSVRQVYFGFTHCPDICPEELDKMATMFDLVEQQRPGVLNPVFVTCDPARDGPKELKEYLLEFHPKFVGLTGTYDQIKAMCKAYRVYFSTPTEVQPGQDYLVDHSIYFYLMDPEGDFVEALGRQHSPDQAASVILDHVKEWKGTLKTS